jgi:glycosyltransferase involved in cell wall biosynthesis
MGASVVIPTHDRRRGIEQTVRAALADEATREVIVVVDGCRDGTYECLVGLARHDSRVRPLWQDNSGASSARQKGVEHARNPVVVLLDDDVVAEPGLITGHVGHHARAPRRVVLGYMPVMGRSTWPENVTSALYSMSYEEQCRRYERDPAHVLIALWAGNMSLRRADALEVGLDNGALPLGYLADRELGLRLMKAGFTGVFDRSLRGWHHYSRSLEGRRRDAVTTARDRWKLHDIHGDVLGPVPPDPWEGGSWPRRLAGRIGAGPASPGLRFVLGVAAYGLGRLGATRASARHLGLLLQTEETRASAAESRRIRSKQSPITRGTEV